MTRESLPDICTAKQGAAFLQCSLAKWKLLEKAGELPTHRLPPLGRMVRYDGAVLRQYGTPQDRARRAAAALRLVATK